MSRGVYKVELVRLSVFGGIVHLYRPGFDRYAPFPLQIHIVKELILHLPLGNGFCQFQKPVCHGAFAVVYMSDYAKISC